MNPKGNPQNLMPPFSKENQPKNRGSKPSKVKQFIKDNTLSYKDVQDLSRHVLQMTESEIKLMALDKETPMVIRLFCRYLMEDMKKGVANNIKMLLDRAVGTVAQKVEAVINPTAYEDLKNLYKDKSE